MLRALFLLFAVGVAGLAAVGIFFSVLLPLAAVAIKVALVLGVGYLLLRLIRPDVADDLKSRLGGSANEV